MEKVQIKFWVLAPGFWRIEGSIPIEALNKKAPLVCLDGLCRDEIVLRYDFKYRLFLARVERTTINPETFAQTLLDSGILNPEWEEWIHLQPQALPGKAKDVWDARLGNIIPA